jgi:hypothetical protein
VLVYFEGTSFFYNIAYHRNYRIRYCSESALVGVKTSIGIPYRSLGSSILYTAIERNQIERKIL